MAHQYLQYRNGGPRTGYMTPFFRNKRMCTKSGILYTRVHASKRYATTMRKVIMKAFWLCAF